MSPKKISKDSVLSIISESKSPLNFKTISNLLHLRKNQRKKLKALIKELRNENRIVKLRSRKYATPKMAGSEKIEGTIEIAKAGFGFLIPEDPSISDIFIEKRNLNGSFPGDRVSAVIISQNYHGKPEGTVREILQRGMKSVISRYNPGKGKPYLLPTDERINLRIDLTEMPDRFELRPGDICSADIHWASYRKGRVRGTVTENFRDMSDPANDAKFLIIKHDIRDEFSPSTIKEIRSIKDNEDLTQREDLSEMDFITIDPPDARDFDDAIYASRSDRGYTIWISIADASSFVPYSSSLDGEARDRANSFYFPGFVVPMLPSEISNHLCSLKQDEKKRCLSVKLELSNTVRVNGVKITQSTIINKLRTDYDKVQKILDGKNSDIPDKYVKMILLMREISQKFFEQRMSEGGIDFDLPQAQYRYDEEGNIVDIESKYRTAANQIVEEFMLVANRTVCEFIASKGRQQIFRVHQEPDPSRITEFYERASDFGYSRLARDLKSSKDLNDFINGIKDKGAARSLRYMLLRSMKQAQYSTSNRGHYGLGFDNYAHFTSPIRRYPDLMTHRILKSVLEGKNSPALDEEKLSSIALHCSKQERVAMECERDILKIKSARFMQDKIGRTFSGYISGKVKGGLFIELKDHMVEGFCPAANLSMKKMPRKRYRGGKRQVFKYTIGDQVKVRVERVVIEELLVEFSLV